MRFEQLEFFCALVKEKTMQAVSEKFFTSPQVVSKALKQLEDELQVPLFTRTKKGLTLTEHGANLFPYAVKLLDYYSYMKNYSTFISSGQNTQINILCNKSLTYLFSAFIKEYSIGKQTNTLDFVLQVAAVQEIRDILQEKNKFDIIATTMNDYELNAFCQNISLSNGYEIYSAPGSNPKFWISKKSQWADKKFVTVPELKNFSFVRYSLEELALDDFLAKHYNIRLHYPFQLNDITLAMELVKDGQCALLAPKSIIDYIFPNIELNDITSLEIDDFQFNYTVVIMLNKNSPELPKPILKCLLDKM